MPSLWSKVYRQTIEDEDVTDIEIAPGVEALTLNADALAEAYGKASFTGLFSSPFLVLCTTAAAIGGFLFGFDQGVISVLLGLEEFLSVFPEIDERVSSRAGFLKGLMTAMLELGAAVGAIQSGYAADKISRKYVLILGTIWFFLGSAMQTGASDYATLVLGRTFGGIGIGTLACIAPIYISEVAPPHLRGALLVFESLLICSGVVVAYWISFACRNIPSDWSFRLPFLLQMAPAVILCFLFIILPFSPRWLCSKGRSREALESLAKLRKLPASDPRVQAEWISIRADVENTRLATQLRHPGLEPDTFRAEICGWVDCFSPRVWRRTIVGVGLMFFQQLIGVNAVIYYSPSLFAALGFPREKQLVFAGIANVMQLVGVIGTVGVIDRFGRKPILYFGSVMCLVCHATIAALIGTYSSDWASNENAALAGVALICIFMFIFGTSWSPIPWTMPPEVMPSSFRSKGVACSTVSNWVWNFVVGLITPILIEKTSYGTFIFFAAFSFLSIVFNYFVVVETANVTLENMDKQFHDSSNHEDNLRLRDIQFSMISFKTARRDGASKAYANEKIKGEISHVEFGTPACDSSAQESERSSQKDQ